MLGAVVEAVTRLSALGEAKILELLSAGKITDVFAFVPVGDPPIPSDTLAEEELVEASPSALTRNERRTLIQSSSSTPSPTKYRPRTASKRQ
jgi:hypothetical protein